QIPNHSLAFPLKIKSRELFFCSNDIWDSITQNFYLTLRKEPTV
ncbi:MAG: hypothetical protein ACI85H_001853, partial [Paracoccaceae bacterium]